MSLSDLLAGRWIPAPAPESDTSLPADAPSLSALLRQPGLGAADLLRSLAAPPSAAAPPQEPPLDSFSSMLDPRLSYGGVPGSIARDLRQAGYSSPNPIAQGGEGDPGSYAQPASYAVPAVFPGRQFLAGTQQTPDYGGQGGGGGGSPYLLLASDSDQPPLSGANPTASPVADVPAPASPNVSTFPPDKPPVGEPSRVPLSGYAIEVAPNDSEAFQRAYDILSGNIHPSRTESAVRGALQGASYGLSAASRAAAVASGISSFVPGSNLLGAVRLGAEAIAPSIFGHAATDRYDQTVSMERAAHALAERDNPVIYNASELAGNLIADRAIGGVPGRANGGVQPGPRLSAAPGASEGAAAAGGQTASVASGAGVPTAQPPSDVPGADLLSAGRRLTAIRSGAGNLTPGQQAIGGATRSLTGGAGGSPPPGAPQTPEPFGQLPPYVYHGDENHPQAILEKGITPRGDSMDLLLHVLDNSNPPSGYVSTSTSADAAYAYGPYVYVIRTPSNAIDVK